MRLTFSILALLINLLAFAIEPEAADTTAMAVSEAQPCDTCCRGAGSFKWIKQLIDNGFSINDKSVCYPKFPRFCLSVYNWGDRTFNSYDHDYVVGTGKNWKLQAKSFNWMETSTMMFPRHSTVRMHSDLYDDAGFSLSFMAVSIGYMWNVNKLFTHPTNRRTFSFDFNCSRFALNYQSVSSTGGMIITQFGDYDGGHTIHYKFDDCSTVSKTFDAYWFFNNYRFSQSAAYSYSKYQLHNAGTALVGFNFTEQSINMDFANLPEDMLRYSPIEGNLYTSKYQSYCMLGGYSYNWVLKPRRWLINATAMAAIGYRKEYNTELYDDTITRLASNFKINLAGVYNHRALFAALTLRAHGFINYNSGDMTHLNTILSFTFAVGMRF